MRQDRDSRSPPPVGQSRIRSPIRALFFPGFGGLPGWEKNLAAE